jgi:hypothetical protein
MKNDLREMSFDLSMTNATNASVIDSVRSPVKAHRRAFTLH